MKAENEFRVIGPPGTGKTTYLANQVARAVAAGRRPLITSLTRAAAVEVGSRIEKGWDFSEDQVGTLHSHCFRALSCPELISKVEHVEDWNKYSKGISDTWELSLSAFVSAKGEDGASGGSSNAVGDRVYADYNILRAKMVPDELWPIDIRGFAKKFNEWRRLSHLMDFSDLIETSFRDKVLCPFSPDVIFVDEAQDHDRLELSLVRQWANDADQLVVCGDPDQNLYEFRGAEPEAFYDHEIPANHYIVLKQSYRVPVSVHAEAVKMISRDKDRRVVEYLAREEQGSVGRLWSKLRQAHEVIDYAVGVAESGRSVMMLATCEYMLQTLLKFMRDAGIPWHNPYAPNRGSFNPLGDRGGITSPQRLLAFLRSDERYYGEDARRWTWSELHAWIDPISVDRFLRRGAKTEIEKLAGTRGQAVIDMQSLGGFLDPVTGMEELRSMSADSLAWYRGRINSSRRKAFDFPLAVIERKGVSALLEKPKIIVGTIHSVKGGEADVVILFPDLSPQGVDSLSRSPASVYRAFYVGMTRARHELLLGQNSSTMAIKW